LSHSSLPKKGKKKVSAIQRKRGYSPRREGEKCKNIGDPSRSPHGNRGGAVHARHVRKIPISFQERKKKRRTLLYRERPDGKGNQWLSRLGFARAMAPKKNRAGGGIQSSTRPSLGGRRKGGLFQSLRALPRQGRKAESTSGRKEVRTRKNRPSLREKY